MTLRWNRRVWLGGCAILMLGVALSAAAAQPDSWSSCDLGDIRIETNFPEARANGCNRQSGNKVAVLITPEQAGVNPSPWYAFRILSDRRRRLYATLVYSEGKHRYWPKLSRDGKTWQRLPARRVRVAADGRTARLRVDVGPKPVWIAAQELWPQERYESWLAGLSGRADVSLSVLGLSGQQRPIHMIATDAGQQRPGTVVLVGRQHPPEVPGAFGLQPFVETVLDDSELSRRFRGVFRLVVVPELNPDGVALGHWRQNAGGMDINRDWGPFTQPETRLMRDLLASIDRDPATRLAVFLDFHATREDVFYTQRDEDPVEPPFFERRWLARLQERMPGYAVNRKPGHQVGLPTAKTWVYEAYGIPSVTFELGDETPRELITTLAEQAARAMMETLLDSPPAGASAMPLTE